MAPGYGKSRTKKLPFGTGAQYSDPIDQESFFSPEKSNKLELKGAVSSVNHFIESPNKPQWSPHFSPNRTQTKEQSSDENRVKRKLDFGSKKHSTKAPKLENKQVLLPGWDLLDDDLDSSATYHPKKLLRDDTSLTLSEDDSFSEKQHGLIKFLKRESQDTEKSDEQSDKDPVISLSPVVRSPVKKSHKAYGERRSYLFEKEEETEQEQKEDEEEIDENYQSDTGDITSTDPSSSPSKENFTSIAHLRLHGKNLQMKDNLNFLIDGIVNSTSSNSTLTSLLEFSLTLFDIEFLNLLTSELTESEFISIHCEIDLNDQYQLYVWAFVVCKISESTSSFTLSDKKPIREIIKKLYSLEEQFPSEKLSRSSTSLFKTLQTKMGKQYTFMFFYLTLLLGHQELIDQTSLNNLACILINSKKDDLDESSFQLAAILLELNLEQNELNGVQIPILIENLLQEPFKSPTCIILTLKLLIRLTSKYTDVVLTKSTIASTLQRIETHIKNEEITSLYIGLLLNLLDSSSETDFIDSKNYEILYDLYTKIGQTSLPYLSLFIGELYTKGFLSISNRVFHFTELNEIKPSLENFDTQGNRDMKLRIEKVLRKL